MLNIVSIGQKDASDRLIKTNDAGHPLQAVGIVPLIMLL